MTIHSMSDQSNASDDSSTVSTASSDGERSIERHAEQAPAPVVETFDLTKRYGTTLALDHVSFSIERGEFFGLLGPNGAGKSTLINMLVTLLRPSSGTATVNGHDITSDPGGVRNSLGIVFQEPALDEELTGEENLTFHSRLYGQRKADRGDRIDDVFELVGLEDERDEPVGTYSGGMKRRLEIGRGLLHEPEVLFLDEPTAGLDVHARRDTWEYLQELNRDTGISIVMTTHYIEEAEQLCDRVAIIDNGTIAAIDSPTNLKKSLGGDMARQSSAANQNAKRSGDVAERNSAANQKPPASGDVVALDIDGPMHDLCARLDSQSWVNGYTETDSGIHVMLEHGETRIADLVRLADETGVRITAVDLHKPSLETVFLSLTGSTISEREADAAVPDGTHERPNTVGSDARATRSEADE